MSEQRLIDANALKKAIKNHFDMLDAYFPNTFIEEIDNAPTVAERPKGECKTCKHYKPIMQRDIFGYSPRCDGYCDIRRMTQEGELEINVNDDFYCKYYERGDDNGKS